MPAELDEVERRVMQLEESSAKRSRRRPTRRRPNACSVSSAARGSERRSRPPEGAVGAGEGRHPATAKAKEELESVRRNRAAQRSGDYAKASVAIRPPARARARDRRGASALASGPQLLKEQVDEEDIAEVVSRWTHIPVSKLMEGEVQKLLEDGGPPPRSRRRRGRGRGRSVERDSSCPRGAAGSNRPLGSFLFLRPTGVGKTEMARALADFLFDDDQAMIRDRHVGIPGEAHRVAADRCASGLRGIRWSRAAHRGCPQASVCRGALRRD